MMLALLMCASINAFADDSGEFDFALTDGCSRASSEKNVYLGYKISESASDEVEVTGCYWYAKPVWHSKGYYNVTGETFQSVTNFPAYLTYQIYIDLPATVTYNGKTYKVTSLAEKCFAEVLQIKELNFEEATNLKTIGRKACYGLSGVSGNANLQSGLTTIGYRAFYGSNYTHIDIPETVTSIGKEGFADMDKMRDVTLRWYTIPTGVSDDFISDCAMLEKASNSILGGLGYIYVPLIARDWYYAYFKKYYESFWNWAVADQSDPRVRAFETANLTNAGATPNINGENGSGYWATLSTDRKLVVPEGVTAYIITDIDTTLCTDGSNTEGQVTLTQAAKGGEKQGSILAGAYLLYSESEISDAYFQEYTSQNSDYKKTMDSDVLKTNILNANITQIESDRARIAEGLTSKNIGNYGATMAARGTEKYVYVNDTTYTTDGTKYNDNARFYVLAKYKGPNYAQDGIKYFGFCYQNKKWWDEEYKSGEEGSAAYITNCRAFLAVDIESADAVSNISALNFVLDNSEATGITEVNAETKTVVKEGIYDLAGRRLQSIPEKGMFIMNGKKYMK